MEPRTFSRSRYRSNSSGGGGLELTGSLGTHSSPLERDETREREWLRPSNPSTSEKPGGPGWRKHPNSYQKSLSLGWKSLSTAVTWLHVGGFRIGGDGSLTSHSRLGRLGRRGH